MILPFKPLALLAPLLGLVSCAGYHLGVAKPAALTKVNTVAVVMFSNATLHPRAEALATSAVANAIVLDGTYRIVAADHADAVLEGSLAAIDYTSIRSTRLDTLHPEELTNNVKLQWTLRDARNPTRVLASGTSVGTSQLYVVADLQTARNNALPDALERAANALVSSITNGF
ncbi:MAG: LPS assembly lipoprotein LptE [Verrucomicrobiota bacterium]